MDYKTNIEKRKIGLIRLLTEIEKREQAILQALHNDFKKPFFEGVMTETGLVTSELKLAIKNLNRWAKPQPVWPSLLNFPSRDYIYREPYGKVLIIAPWNYPFQLAMVPLISAVAAGNQVVLKPSELTPHTAGIITEIISQVFETHQAQVVQGDSIVAQELLSRRWDYIFFTGSVGVGKIVAEAAAKNLTPTTLELGGKNPCIIDNTASLELAAKRIVWGKFLNAGQTCIAPDYLLVHEKVKADLVKYLIREIQVAYGENPHNSSDFCRIINFKNWQRLTGSLHGQNILYGGQFIEEELYLAPTLIDQPDRNSSLMTAEIFGPILPILSYKNENELAEIIQQYEKPLSLYVFSNNPTFIQKILTNFAFGGGAINDTVVQFANKKLPFGGVGHSGIGAYHGRWGFETFTHRKAIVRKYNWLDLPFRYAPYQNKIGLIRKLLDWF
ncbi:aldehyde dehydrogenase [Flavobacterium sp. CYK-4]|uniref:aldehyde dehydrogenase n=1 Tax=Flavobacterium lotistagni TaxID=2709660 RepID=UPI00140AEF96|nr:aldehyde dehydrogenase [Flavobacterium lotistagni]NHM08237.1 aldehyde dehydrogenase [Flavobacterium lotistagni]